MPLRRVGADTHMILSRKNNHILDSGQIVRQCRRISMAHERPEVGNADHAATGTRRANQGIRNIALQLFQSCRKDMRKAWRFL